MTTLKPPGSTLPDYLYDVSKFDDRFSANMLDQSANLMHQAQQSFTKSYSWFEQLVGTIPKDDLLVASVVAVLSTIAILLIFLGDTGTSAKRRGNGKMRHHQRQQQLRRMVADFVTDAIEDARYKDEITRQEKKQLYRYFAVALKDTDLLPPPHPNKVKSDIRKRKATIAKITPKIPGETPPDIKIKPARPALRKRHGAISGLLKAAVV